MADKMYNKKNMDSENQNPIIVIKPEFHLGYIIVRRLIWVALLILFTLTLAFLGKTIEIKWLEISMLILTLTGPFLWIILFAIVEYGICKTTTLSWYKDRLYYHKKFLLKKERNRISKCETSANNTLYHRKVVENK